MSSSILLIGPPFQGKTYSLATLPGRTILFNFQPEGYLAIRKPLTIVSRLDEYWKIPPEKRGDFCVVDYAKMVGKLTVDKEGEVKRDKIGALIDDSNSLLNHLNEFDNIAEDAFGDFSTEVLDFVTALQNRKDVQIQDYKYAGKKVRDILRFWQFLGKNLVVLAHWQYDKDETTGRSRQVPQTWGKDLPIDIMKIFSVALGTKITTEKDGKVKYEWNTKPEGLIESLGSRLHDNLPKYIPQDFGAFFKLAEREEVK